MLIDCQECSASISEQAKECPKCGAPPNTFLGAARQCAECGGGYRPAYPSCPNCGAPRDIAARVDVGTGAFPSFGTPITSGQASGKSLRPEVDYKLYPWARWGAKWIDTAIFAIGLAIIMGLGGFDWYSESANIIFAFAFVLSFPFWDAVLIAATGGSPGRAIFRFRVLSRTTERNAAFREAIARSWGAWFYGCGLGIPVVALFTLTMSKSYLEKNGESRWDKEARTYVEHSGPQWWSWGLLIVTIFAMYALSVVRRY